MRVRALVVLAGSAAGYAGAWHFLSEGRGPWSGAALALALVTAFNTQVWSRVCASAVRPAMGTVSRATSYLVRAHDHVYRMDGPWWTGNGRPEAFIATFGWAAWGRRWRGGGAGVWAAFLMVALIEGGWREGIALMSGSALLVLGGLAGRVFAEGVDAITARWEGATPGYSLPTAVRWLVLAALWSLQVGLPLAWMVRSGL